MDTCVMIGLDPRIVEDEAYACSNCGDEYYVDEFEPVIGTHCPSCGARVAKIDDYREDL